MKVRSDQHCGYALERMLLHASTDRRLQLELLYQDALAELFKYTL